MDGYRRELKFIVDDAVLADVRNRIEGILQLDSHQKGDFYKIRSIYLDSPDYECLRENEAGISTREKYRIRAYNCKEDKISAEIKIRHRETISKMSVDISKDILDAIINNQYYDASELLFVKKNTLSESLKNIDDVFQKRKIEGMIRTLEKYIQKLSSRLYQPAVIVDYERCAYIYEPCNVRITFDRNVSASRQYDRFFDADLPGRVAIEGGMHVLEIKYDEFLPDEIAIALQGLGLERDSCSKYARCMYTYRI